MLEAGIRRASRFRGGHPRLGVVAGNFDSGTFHFPVNVFEPHADQRNWLLGDVLMKVYIHVGNVPELHCSQPLAYLSEISRPALPQVTMEQTHGQMPWRTAKQPIPQEQVSA